ISPFKKDSAPKIKKVKKVKSLPTSPPSFIQEDQEPGSPFYMPQESPSRDNYMDRYHSPSTQSTRSSPTACEYCGSYVDADTEYCSICGNRVRSEY
ncbi:MAG: hypothetical protein ACFFDW_07020, partial [Candidatus Thorarchaeota archaeon]